MYEKCEVMGGLVAKTIFHAEDEPPHTSCASQYMLRHQHLDLIAMPASPHHQMTRTPS
jgi:hypothetical protein